LHVGIIGYLLWTIARVLRIPRKWAVAFIIPALFFYAAITGFNTASMRAAVMAAVLLGGVFVDRKVLSGNSVAAAAVLILAFDTNQLFATGFQLSFAVVGTIILLAEPLDRLLMRWCQPDPFLPSSLLSPLQKGWLSGWGTIARGASVSLAAWIGSLPLILPYFYLITPVSLFANLAVVPLAFFVSRSA
jgi:ComEC/Rec2-related protein